MSSVLSRLAVDPAVRSPTDSQKGTIMSAHADVPGRAPGGLLIASLGLDDPNLIGRLFLVFAFLTACQAVLERLQRRNGNAHHQQE
jgi:hypothetical protein